MPRRAKKNMSLIQCNVQKCGEMSGVYMLGFVGAVVYYISTAAGFWAGVLGFLKAIIWPAFLIFHLMKSLGM